MKYLSIRCFFNKDSLTTSVLIAAGDIVIKSELSWWGHPFRLIRLFHDNVLPFTFSLILQEIKIDLVETLIYGMGNDRFRFLQLTVHLQQVDLNLVVWHFAHQN